MEIREDDLNTSAFLKVKGLKLLRVEGEHHKTFVFEDVHESGATAQALKYAFLNGAQVPARDFAAAQRELKSLIYGNGNRKDYGNTRPY